MCTVCQTFEAFENAAGAAGTGTPGLLTSTPDYSVDQIADFLNSGFWGGSQRVWDTSSDTTLTVDISALTATGQSHARNALDAWADITGLEFVEVTGGADITFDDEASGAYATYSFSDGYISAAYVNVNKTFAGGDAGLDSYHYQTYIHEIGHALGLGHAGYYNGSATYGSDNHYANDSWQMSTMSYFDQTENTSVSASFAYTLTPMIADIVAIQDLYGVSTARSGDTIYGEGGNTGTYLDAWLSLTNSVALTIYDSGGIDTINLASQSYDQRIDMGEEAISDVQGLIGNLIIARGSVIENVETGDGDDHVTGNTAANVIKLGAGDDTAYGGAGFDEIEGGSGADQIWGGDQADTLIGQDGADSLYGEAGADRLAGDAGNDMLDGGDGDDAVWGGDDDDTLLGGAGNDRLYGGAGNDDLSGGAGDDLLDGGSFEDVLRGGDGMDTLLGGAGFDLLEGGSGDDDLDGGGQADNLYGDAGNDLLKGGQGFDRLFGGLGDDTLLGGDDDDALFGQDNDDRLEGEGGADRLFGGTGDDLLFGGTGDDVLSGDAGFDVLDGGAGADTLTGAFNADTFIFADGCGTDTITDFEATNLYERIDLSGLTTITDWLDLSNNHLSYDASNCYIDAGSGDKITLLAVDFADLDAGDFVF